MCNVQLEAPAVADGADLGGEDCHLRASSRDRELKEFVKVGRDAALKWQPGQQRVHHAVSRGGAEHARGELLEWPLAARPLGEE